MGRKRLLTGLTVKDGFMRHPFDIEHNVHTSGLVRGPHLAIGHPHDKHTTAYYGIAPSVLEELCALWRRTSLVAPPEDYSFIDIGAGMGRGLLIAARMPFREVIGVELHPTLAEIAQKNIDKWLSTGRARCPMKIVCQDVTEYEFPANPCVAYMFNPFGEPVIKKLVRHLESQFAGRPGQLDLLYANDEYQDVLTENSKWARLWRGLIPLSAEDEAADMAILNHQPEGEYAWSTEEPCSIFRWAGSNRVGPSRTGPNRTAHG
jgi:SAM-dependent methyltransferase